MCYFPPREHCTQSRPCNCCKSLPELQVGDMVRATIEFVSCCPTRPAIKGRIKRIGKDGVATVLTCAGASAVVNIAWLEPWNCGSRLRCFFCDHKGE